MLQILEDQSPIYQIGENELHVWDFYSSPKYADDLYHYLSLDEKERASRLIIKERQQQYIQSRAVLRRLLSQYLNCKPNDIMFDYHENGKPFLKSFTHIPLSFNLSHSQELSVYVFALQKELGVDVEKLQPTCHLTLAKRFFSEEEYHYLLQINDTTLQSQCFYQIWSQKEAIIKATGEKLSVVKNLSTLSHLTGGVMRLQDKQWGVVPLLIDQAYASTLVYSDLATQIFRYHYGHDIAL